MQENSKSQETKAASGAGERCGRTGAGASWELRREENTPRQFAARKERAKQQNNAKYIFMNKGLDRFQHTHQRLELKDLKVSRRCQLLSYSRRSAMIHYAADVSRVRVQRGI